MRTVLLAAAAAAASSSFVAVGAPSTAATAPVLTHHSQVVPLAIGSRAEVDHGGAVTIADAPTTGVATAQPYGSAIDLDGLVGTVTDVDVTLHGFAHAWPRDVDVLLVSPSGTGVTLMSDVGGTKAVDLPAVTFDDSVLGSVPVASIDSGAYRPTDADAALEGDDVFPAPAPTPTAGPLSTFNGEPGRGTWRLYVVDDSPGGSGAIDSWTLDVDTTGPVASTIVVSGTAGPVTDVDLSLEGLSHGRTEDLDVLLVGPGGQQVTVLSDVPTGAPVQGAVLVLDDEAVGPTGPVVSGRFRPTDVEDGSPDAWTAAPAGAPGSALSGFDGVGADGTWTLLVEDDLPQRPGSLAGWSLTITTQPAETTPIPTPVPQPVPGDTTAPRVVRTTPPAGRTGVRRTTSAAARIDEAVRFGTLGRRTAYLTAVGSSRKVRAVVRYREGSVVIDPRRDLRPRTTYRVVLTSGIRDLAGNALSRTSWRFTTR